MDVTSYFTTIRVTDYQIDASLNNTIEGAITFFYVNFVSGSPISAWDVRNAFLGGLEGGNRIGGSVVLPDTLIVLGGNFCHDHKHCLSLCYTYFCG